VAADPVLFERVKGLLTKELADLREEGEIRDPAPVKGKGRPRLKSAAEPKESGRHNRCGRCGGEWHNARTCDN